mgnify:CR=1 FL=1
MKQLISLWFVTTAMALPAQQVWLQGGDVLAGSVTAVKDNRVQIRGSDGALRQLPVRQVDREVAADGSVRRFAAAAREGELTPPERALLQQVGRGAELGVPELVAATDRPSTALLAALRERLHDDREAAQIAAAQALAATAVPDAVRAALAAAVERRSERMLAAVAAASTSGAQLGALAEADAGDLIARGFAAREAVTRFTMAWIGVQLEVEGAQPVLAKFVRDRDHHRREAAAMALAEHGNDVGAAVLLTIARRERAPVQQANRDADAATRAFVDRLALRERCRACELLGALRHEPALPALERLSHADDVDLAAAARAAVAAIRDGAGAVSGDRDR